MCCCSCIRLFIKFALLIFIFSVFILTRYTDFCLPPSRRTRRHNCQRGSGIFESCPHFYGLSNLHSFYISGPGLPYASNERCLHWGSMAEPRLLLPCHELKAEFKAYSKNWIILKYSLLLNKSENKYFEDQSLVLWEISTSIRENQFFFEFSTPPFGAINQ